MTINTLKSIAFTLMMGLFVSACADSNTSTGSSTTTSTSSGVVSSSGVASGEGYLTQNVLDRVYFNTDRATLNSSARATLLTQSEWLKENGNISLIIEGHADERGTREYNLALGARRANAVRDFLISQGVSASRLATISYGKERPVSLCSSQSCWNKNRRSVSVVR